MLQFFSIMVFIRSVLKLSSSFLILFLICFINSVCPGVPVLRMREFSKENQYSGLCNLQPKFQFSRHPNPAIII